MLVTSAGYAYRNYVSDPVEWCNLFKISWKGPPGVYRLVAPVTPGEMSRAAAPLMQTMPVPRSPSMA